MQEGPVKRDPSARANHDDWSIIGWQSEMRVALDVNRQDRVRLGAIGQHTRSDASTGLAMKRIAHGRYGKVRFVWRSRPAGRDGIEARRSRPQRTSQDYGGYGGNQSGKG